jgi:hypothetical protein
MCYIFTEEHVNPKFAERSYEWFQDTGGPLLK